MKKTQFVFLQHLFSIKKKLFSYISIPNKREIYQD